MLISEQESMLFPRVGSSESSIPTNALHTMAMQRNDVMSDLLNSLFHFYIYYLRLYRNEEFVMDYNGPKTKEHLIKFVSSVNAKGPMLIEDLDDINQLRYNSTDKFFVSYAFKV